MCVNYPTNPLRNTMVFFLCRTINKYFRNKPNYIVLFKINFRMLRIYTNIFKILNENTTQKVIVPM